MNTFAYKGYLVTHNLIRGTYIIHKDGYYIGSAETADTARRTIDSLVS